MNLLLDEHLSPRLVEIVHARQPQVDILSIYHWRDGALTNRPDDEILRAAACENRVLITFDLRTIPSILTEFWIAGEDHGGVVFISSRTFLPNNLKAIGQAIASLAAQQDAEDWTNRTAFLTRE